MPEELIARLEKIKQEIKAACNKVGRDPSAVKILGASKEKPATLLKAAYDAGLKCFGENKVQDLLSKHLELPRDIEWHFIGHLQRNKVSKILPFVNCIQSLDREELALEINKRAEEIKKRVDCLIEVNIDLEKSKSGIEPDYLPNFLNLLKPLKGIRIVGLMAIPAPLPGNREAFKKMKKLSGVLKKDLQLFHVELSMGMSHDFVEAIEEGATIVRIGEALFGPRE